MLQKWSEFLARTTQNILSPWLFHWDEFTENLYPQPSKNMAKDWLRVAIQQPTILNVSEGNVLQPIPGFVVVIAKTSELMWPNQKPVLSWSPTVVGSSQRKANKNEGSVSLLKAENILFFSILWWKFSLKLPLIEAKLMEMRSLSESICSKGCKAENIAKDMGNAIQRHKLKPNSGQNQF